MQLRASGTSLNGAARRTGSRSGGAEAPKQAKPQAARPTAPHSVQELRGSGEESEVGELRRLLAASLRQNERYMLQQQETQQQLVESQHQLGELLAVIMAESRANQVELSTMAREMEELRRSQRLRDYSDVAYELSIDTPPTELSNGTGHCLYDPSARSPAASSRSATTSPTGARTASPATATPQSAVPNGGTPASQRSGILVPGTENSRHRGVVWCPPSAAVVPPLPRAGAKD